MAYGDGVPVDRQPFPEFLSAAQQVRLQVARTLAEHWEFDSVGELLTEASAVAAWVEEGGEPGDGLPSWDSLVAMKDHARLIERWGRLWPAARAWAHGQGQESAATLANVVQEINNETGEQA